MSDNALQELYDVVLSRKAAPSENSYTCYLFEQGLDKILKKCGEECAEVIIAAKGDSREDLKNEICDLLYHLTVLMAAQGVGFDEIEAVLTERSGKIGNLKQFKKTDKET